MTTLAEISLPAVDIFPAEVHPLPPGVPERTRLRALTAGGRVVLAWSSADGTEVHHAEVPEPTEGEAVSLAYYGGTYGQYQITRGGGCGCGYSALKRWQPER